MKPWRKLHSSILESERFMDVPLESKVLFFLLVAAQDDTGYYPWERMKVRRLVAVCGWSEAQARKHADALVAGGMATWEEGGIVLRNGAKLNGQNREDRKPLVYQRSTTDIPLTDNGSPVVNPEGEGEGEREGDKKPPISPLKGDMLSQEQQERFNTFWEAYPRKENKGKAVQAWKKLKPSGELVNTMLRAIFQQKTSRQWADGVIPHAATWLNGRRWEDEVTSERSVNGNAQSGRGTELTAEELRHKRDNEALGQMAARAVRVGSPPLHAR